MSASTKGVQGPLFILNGKVNDKKFKVRMLGTIVARVVNYKSEGKIKFAKIH